MESVASPISDTSDMADENSHDSSKQECDYAYRIRKVLRYLEERIYDNRLMENSEEPIRLEELASVAGFSPYHFHRIFSGMVGETVKAYVRRIRMEFAAHHLSHSKMPVAQVALEAGYQSQESFSRAFKIHFGLSPAAYRTMKPQRAQVVKSSTGERNMPMNQQDSSRHCDVAVEVKSYPAIRVAAVRHVGPYAECTSAWETLCAWAGPKGLFTPSVQFLGVCHDDPQVTPSDKIRFDACMTVGDDVQGEGEIVITEIPAGEYAVAEHKGPYEALCVTYAAICGQWGPISGREFATAPSIEWYITDPKTTPPEESRTEVRLPLR